MKNIILVIFSLIWSGLFAQGDNFTALDNYARNMPAKYEQDIPTLAAYLRIPAKNELQKARVIFTWVATHINYDNDAFNNHLDRDCSADSVLRNRKSVCEGYSNLYLQLATAMGLEAQKISGYCKGYGYQPGDRITKADHAWNVVKTDNHWILLDATWGSMESSSDSGFLVSKAKLDPYWFNVNPREFIFTHLPEEWNWQLTGGKMSLTQFEALPYLDEDFFKVGFDSERIFADAVSGGVKEFADVYEPVTPLKAVELPYGKTLRRGRPITLVIKSDSIEQMTISDKDTWKDIWKDFDKKGNEFRIVFTPVGDNVDVVYRTATHYFTTLVTYKVSQN